MKLNLINRCQATIQEVQSFLLSSSSKQNRRSIVNDPVYRLIQTIPFGKRALHDIHLTFEVKGLWSVLSSTYQHNPDNMGIQFPTWSIKDLNIMVAVQHTDTVSVDVGCSYCPVAVDVSGVIRLSNALSMVEDKPIADVIGFLKILPSI
jgi:hypothetical protein